VGSGILAKGPIDHQLPSLDIHLPTQEHSINPAQNVQAGQPRNDGYFGSYKDEWAAFHTPHGKAAVNLRCDTHSQYHS